MKKQRIWEIDALRGFMILCVILAHALYCGEFMLGLYRVPQWLNTFLFQYAGSLFVILSGISATLGHRSVKRGLIVFGCGMILTLGSWIAVLLGFVDEGFLIKFGVLHLLGLCMLLYPLLKKLPDLALLLFAVPVIGLGYWFTSFTVEPRWLFPLGLVYPGFSSGDFFPLFPQLGWFCIGILLGRWIYQEKQTRFPTVNAEALPIRVLCWIGRNSLPIFVCHLPVVGGIMYLIAMLIQR